MSKDEAFELVQTKLDKLQDTEDGTYPLFRIVDDGAGQINVNFNDPRYGTITVDYELTDDELDPIYDDWWDFHTEGMDIGRYH